MYREVSRRTEYYEESNEEQETTDGWGGVVWCGGK